MDDFSDWLMSYPEVLERVAQGKCVRILTSYAFEAEYKG